jgi:hypothetical protein
MPLNVVRFFARTFGKVTASAVRFQPHAISPETGLGTGSAHCVELVGVHEPDEDFSALHE